MTMRKHLPRAALWPWLLPILVAAQTANAPSAATVSRLLFQARFSAMDPGPVTTGWRLVGLPDQKAPLTRFDIQVVDAGAVLRIQAERSYGNLVFEAGGMQMPSRLMLRWRWRLDQGLPDADLRRKDGDDTPVKVCALFDMPLKGMAYGEQARLRIARAMTGEPLPAATLCYVWDRLLPEGSSLPNVFSARVRYLVATHGAPRPGQWVEQSRDLGQDFMRAFGHETRVLPPLIAIAVGADADNTGGSSLALVADLALAQP